MSLRASSVVALHVARRASPLSLAATAIRSDLDCAVARWTSGRRTTIFAPSCARWLSTDPTTATPVRPMTPPDEGGAMPPTGDDDLSEKKEYPMGLLYEGPFAKLSLRLKRVSITTAAVSLVGMPLLIALHGGDVPATGQLAVGGTAVFAATGSTIALSYCFSPYVHTLERVAGGEGGKAEEGEMQKASSALGLLRATTRNIVAMKVETVFDPAKDVMPSSGSRPFCNFVAKGVPLYVHPELIEEDELRTRLVGDVQDKEERVETKNDEFL